MIAWCSLCGCPLAIYRRTLHSFAMDLTRLLRRPAALCLSSIERSSWPELRRQLSTIYSCLMEHYFIFSSCYSHRDTQTTLGGLPVTHRGNLSRRGSRRGVFGLPGRLRRLGCQGSAAACWSRPWSRVGKAEQPLGKHDKNTEIVGKSLAVVWFSCVSTGFCLMFEVSEHHCGSFCFVSLSLKIEASSPVYSWNRKDSRRARY